MKALCALCSPVQHQNPYRSYMVTVAFYLAKFVLHEVYSAYNTGEITGLGPVAAAYQ